MPGFYALRNNSTSVSKKACDTGERPPSVRRLNYQQNLSRSQAIATRCISSDIVFLIKNFHDVDGGLTSVAV
jgi:hypothetical protein